MYGNAFCEILKGGGIVVQKCGLQHQINPFISLAARVLRPKLLTSMSLTFLTTKWMTEPPGMP